MNFNRRSFLKAAAAAGVLSSVTSSEVEAQSSGDGADWPMFQYDAANTGHNPNTTGPVESIEEKWRYKPKESDKNTVSSGPVVANNTVYLGTQGGNVYALDATTGNQQWIFEVPNSPMTEPAVVDGTVYVGSSDNSLYAVDASSGEEVWRFEIRNYVRSSPTVVDGTVYFGSHANRIYAIDAVDGTEKWNFETTGVLKTSPAVVNGTVYAGSHDSRVYAVDATTGSQKWIFQTGSRVYSSPAVVGNTVYVGSWDNNVYALEAGSGKEKWRYGTGDQVFTSPAVAGGTVYVGSKDNNMFYALSADTGNQRWSFEVGDQIKSSAAVVDSTVYFGSKDNNVYALDATNGEQRWVFETGDSVVGPPAVVDGTVYVGSKDGNLYALEEKGRSSGGGGITGNGGTSENGGDTTTDDDGDTSGSDTTGVPWTIIGGGVGGLLAVAGIAKLMRSSSDTETPTEKDATRRQDTETKKGSEKETEEDEQPQKPESASTPQKGDKDEETAPQDTERHRDAVASSQDTEDAKEKRDTEITKITQLDAEFEDFEKVDLIGSGGNADVHRARITVDGDENIVALKTPRMHNYETVDTSFFDKFVKEAETWNKIDDHENIVSVLDWGRKPHPWIALEYMDAGNLRDKTPLSVERGTEIMGSVADATQYAHRHGVVHGDLKPENILFKAENGREVVKVADWGLAKVLLDHSRSTEGLSPAYAAPEQFTDHERDAEGYQLTDIYQLGAVAYEVFAGKPPFDGATFEMMEKIKNETPEPPSSVNPSVPEEIDEIVLRAIAKDPDERFGTALHFREAIDEVEVV